MIEINIEKKLRGSNGGIALRCNETIASGSVMGIYGKSGSGKTSLLRIIAGLMRPDKGYIKKDGITWQDDRLCLTASDRQLRYLTQTPTLFPNMTVSKNIQFSSTRNLSFEQISQWLQFMELSGHAETKPQKLSGGQRQRVALICALADRKPLLLLDEPFSAQDEEMRGKLLDFLRAWRVDTTIIYVSHQVKDLFKICDHILKVTDGEVQRLEPGALSSISKEVLVGDIIAKSDGCFHVLIGDNFYKLPISERGDQYQIGDKIELRLH